MKIEFKTLAKDDIDDFKKLIHVFEEAFEMENFIMPHDQHLHRLLERDSFFAIVANSEERIIGGLTLYILDQYYSERPLAYIFDLAVSNSYQRKGIGTQLIEFVKDFCRQNNFEEVFVQADRVDGYAVDFYRKTRPTEEEDVIHFYYNL
ncbi:GNAT family N-acetyltransferase [Algoriphagus sp. AGSA1]|uniref:GNAT family N-acetyltransferase n=1 Tax=Algoriphagus sp. AGSA1 TaxID=2907213 RepID=UPI001F214691|nr:GNAT family N-acetyltransferase [Algoriphagus sp. AGSA1]MCE7055182.1 GNAT family N-acetyltransferase [Algoriphagus sp. AGSA1]